MLVSVTVNKAWIEKWLLSSHHTVKLLSGRLILDLREILMQTLRPDEFSACKIGIQCNQILALLQPWIIQRYVYTKFVTHGFQHSVVLNVGSWYAKMVYVIFMKDDFIWTILENFVTIVPVPYFSIICSCYNLLLLYFNIQVQTCNHGDLLIPKNSLYFTKITIIIYNYYSYYNLRFPLLPYL
jgi:hypothetical protein